MAKANVYAGAVLTLFAAYFVYEALKLPFWAEGGVGPGAGALPQMAGIVFGALSVALVVRNLRPATAQTGEADFSRWPVTAQVLGAIFLAVLLAKTLGMLLTIFFFMCFHTIVVARTRWKVALPTSAIAAGAFYFVFEVWLGIPLVVGVFGI